MIQFCTVIILYNIASNLGNWQFLYIDLFLIIPLSLTMSRTGAYNKLTKTMPTGHLISFTILMSVFGQIIVQSIFQIAIYFLLRRKDWFEPLEPEGDKNILCYENTTLFLLSTAQYIIVVIVFSVGKPFRKPMYTNYAL